MQFKIMPRIYVWQFTLVYIAKCHSTISWKMSSHFPMNWLQGNSMCTDSRQSIWLCSYNMGDIKTTMQQSRLWFGHQLHKGDSNLTTKYLQLAAILKWKNNETNHWKKIKHINDGFLLKELDNWKIRCTIRLKQISGKWNHFKCVNKN